MANLNFIKTTPIIIAIGICWAHGPMSYADTQIQDTIKPGGTISIPIQYTIENPIEQTREYDIKEDEIIKFTNHQEAEDFKKKYGGVVIHEQGKNIWYIFPKEIEGWCGMVSWKEED